MTTAGRPVGMAEIGEGDRRGEHDVEVVAPGQVDARPTASSATPAMMRIWLVSAASCRVSGVSLSSWACSMPEMCPTSVDMPVAVTTKLARAAGDVGVHVDHVGPVAERRVGRRHRLDALGRPGGSRRSAPTRRSRGSPRAAAARRPARGRRPRCCTTSPGTRSSAGSSASRPSRRTFALTIIIFCRARDGRRGLALLLQAERRR